MQSLLTYFGGKQKLTPVILPLIPKHKLYVEPFCGGAAVFWAKPPSRIEVLNDINGLLINFYQVVKTRFPELKKLILATAYSRDLHHKARFIWNLPHAFTEIERAWAVYIMAFQSYSSVMDSTWSCGRTDATAEKRFTARKAALAAEYADRLNKVQLESRDALEVITTRDTADTLFYLDPPYIGTAMGHYAGYTAKDFEQLLSLLSKIKGKFLLSSFPTPLLEKYIRKYKWYTKRIEMNLSVQGAKKNGRRKTEVLTANYPI